MVVMIADDIESGLYRRPCMGEIVSGDAGLAVRQEAGVFLAIVDVLGHGPEAHGVAENIVRYLHENAGSDLVRIVQSLHQQLRRGLGAAVGLVYLERATGRLHYVGIGNTRIRRIGSVESRLVSRDGTVGCHMPTPREMHLQLEAGDLLLLTTDGVKERFCVEDYPGMLGDSAAVVARQVVQRFGKEHDDATCLAVRYQP
jgi:serine phosphatase RsbU (regulator of sigma subunit)